MTLPRSRTAALRALGGPLALALALAGCSSPPPRTAPGGGAPAPRRAEGGPPRSAITDAPLGEQIAESEELSQATRQHAAITDAGARGGPRLVQEGSERARVMRVFGDVVAVAHRAELPWQVYLLQSRDPALFSTGAGYVYLCSELIGERERAGEVSEAGDAALAALLAHEVAHIALEHTRARKAWELAAVRARANPYGGIAFSAAQELEADRLAALYLALAGYDPTAAEEFWEGAAEHFRGNPGTLLRDHPLGAARIAPLRDASRLALAYYTPNRQQLGWAEIRDNNALFPRGLASAEAGAAAALRTAGRSASGSAEARAETPSRASGWGPESGREAPAAARSPRPAGEAPAPPPSSLGNTARALNAALEAEEESPEGGEAARDAAPAAPAPVRSAPAAPAPAPAAAALELPASPLLGYLHMLKVQTGSESDGSKSAQIYLQNQAEKELLAVSLRVVYFEGEREIASDPGCGGSFPLPSGSAAWLLCELRRVPGATGYEIHLSGAQFR